MLDNRPLDAAPKAVYSGKRDILDTLDQPDGRTPSPQAVTYDLTANSTAVLVALHKVIQNQHFVPSPLQARIVFLLYLERIKEEIEEDIALNAETEPALLETVERLMTLSAAFMRRHLHDMEPMRSAVRRKDGQPQITALLRRLDKFIMRYRELKVDPRIKEEETGASQSSAPGSPYSPRPGPGASIAWFIAVVQSGTASDLEVLLARFMKRTKSPEVVLGLRETSYQTSLLSPRHHLSSRPGRVTAPNPVSVPKAVSNAVSSLTTRAKDSGIPFTPAIDHTVAPDTTTGRRRVVASASIEPVMDNGRAAPAVVRRRRSHKPLGIAGQSVSGSEDRPARHRTAPARTDITGADSRGPMRPRAPPRTAPSKGTPRRQGATRKDLRINLPQTDDEDNLNKDPFAWCGAFHHDFDSPRGVYHAPPSGMSHGRPPMRQTSASVAAMLRENREAREREEEEEMDRSARAQSRGGTSRMSNHLSGARKARATRAANEANQQHQHEQQQHYYRRPATTAATTRGGRARTAGADDIDQPSARTVYAATARARTSHGRSGNGRGGTSPLPARAASTAKSVRFGVSSAHGTAREPMRSGSRVGGSSGYGDGRSSASTQFDFGASRPSTAASLSKTDRFIHELEMSDWARTAIYQIRQARAQMDGIDGDRGNGDVDDYEDDGDRYSTGLPPID